MGKCLHCMGLCNRKWTQFNKNKRSAYNANIITSSSSYIVSWHPEGRYHYSKMFCWEPEGPYRSIAIDFLNTAIAPFWFSMEHLWTLIAPFWLSTDNMIVLRNNQTRRSLKNLRLLGHPSSNLAVVFRSFFCLAEGFGLASSCVVQRR